MKNKDFTLCNSVRVDSIKLDVGEWAVMIFHNEKSNFGDVVVGWYRTRKLAREHAKKIRDAINALV